MFKNPGKKLKGLAKWIFWISMICYVLFGVALMFGANITANGTSTGSLQGPAAIIAGVLVIAVGFLVSWLSGIFVYAAGAAVDDLQTIKKLQLEQYKRNSGEV